MFLFIQEKSLIKVLICVEDDLDYVYCVFDYNYFWKLKIFVTRYVFFFSLYFS